MKDLAKAMEACEKFDELKEEFISTLCVEMKSRGLSELDTKELGEAVDIIKDFAEAKKDCMEALYYQKVTETMLSSEEPRYGYNSNRWSNGRYAPKGMGTRGYMGAMSYAEDPIYYDEDWNVMGYGGQSGGNNSGRSNSSNNNSSSNGSYGYSDWHMHRDPEYDERYGRSYNDFRKNRRFYTATKSEEEKKDMERHAEEHVQDFIVSIKDIWKDADPNLKKRMKDSLNRFVSELSI